MGNLENSPAMNFKSPFSTSSPGPILVNVNSGSLNSFAIAINEQNSQNELSVMEEDNEVSKFEGEFFEKAFNTGKSRKQR